MPTPPGPYPSKLASSYCSPSSWPVPRRMARSTFSPGMFAAFAARIAVRRRGLEFDARPLMRAAMLITRMIRVNTRPRFASVAPFLCLIVAHFECPDMTHPRLFRVTAAWPGSSMEEFLRRRAVSENAGRLRPHSTPAVSLPNTTRTEERSPRKSAVLRPPNKITPMRRLTVNRKPLRNHGSLAQPPTSGNGLYSTVGHLVESDRFLHGHRASRHNPRTLPCLPAGTASSPSQPIPSNT